MGQIQESKFGDVPIRVRSWGVIIVIFSLSLLHPLLTCIFLSFLSFVAIRELMAMLSYAKYKKLSVLLFFLAVFECYILYKTTYTYFLTFVLFYVLVLIGMSRYLYQMKSIKHNLQIALGIILCVFSIGHLVYIRGLYSDGAYINGVKVLVLLVVLTELNDVFQYLTGKIFGKHKITPKISPNKTLEGLIGGVILTTSLANILGLFLLPNKGILIYSLIGFLIAVLGFCGDIYMSSIKRKAGVKDTSNLIPGHGGLLDRIDSLLFITPIYYSLIYFLYIDW